MVLPASQIRPPKTSNSSAEVAEKIPTETSVKGKNISQVFEVPSEEVSMSSSQIQASIRREQASQLTPQKVKIKRKSRAVTPQSLSKNTLAVDQMVVPETQLETSSVTPSEREVTKQEKEITLVRGESIMEVSLPSQVHVFPIMESSVTGGKNPFAATQGNTSSSTIKSQLTYRMWNRKVRMSTDNEMRVLKCLEDEGKQVFITYGLRRKDMFLLEYVPGLHGLVVRGLIPTGFVLSQESRSQMLTDLLHQLEISKDVQFFYVKLDVDCATPILYYLPDFRKKRRFKSTQEYESLLPQQDCALSFMCIGY